MFGSVLAHGAPLIMRLTVGPERDNNTMPLGLNGTAVKGKGGIDAFGFANAFDIVIGVLNGNVNRRISEACESSHRKNAPGRREPAGWA